MLLEINQRSTNYGLTVSLLWDDSTNETFIEMETEEDWSRFLVPPEQASDAFAHPFIYQTKAASMQLCEQSISRTKARNV